MDAFSRATTVPINAYLNLKRYTEARRIFEAVLAIGNRGAAWLGRRRCLARDMAAQLARSADESIVTVEMLPASSAETGSRSGCIAKCS
ncbi:hypothetical protein AC244_19755 [Ensifer adhaerens]|uniref:Uncharacterized protein n=1 Tax=Ensifer adhaerens TaxID=106592 RepID=A0A0L8BQE9_ENSAD|nr:hypothetical protein [Ensifer adhaerens]KOF16808.1 hypothetical protein AC244_19755 [Ensifer adhaerens]